MKFIETLHGGCLLNVSEIVSIYKVGLVPAYFPYQHTANDFKEVGIYAAVKIGKICHSLPLVTSMGITACAYSELSDSEVDRYRYLLKNTGEMDSILSEIIYELKRQIGKTSGCIDTWDVVLRSIRKRREMLSEEDYDKQSNDGLGDK